MTSPLELGIGAIIAWATRADVLREVMRRANCTLPGGQVLLLSRLADAGPSRLGEVAEALGIEGVDDEVLEDHPPTVGARSSSKRSTSSTGRRRTGGTSSRLIGGQPTRTTSCGKAASSSTSSCSTRRVTATSSGWL